MAVYKPPFRMTTAIVELLMNISEQLGRITVMQDKCITSAFRRQNFIKSVHSSLAMEGQSLSPEQLEKMYDEKEPTDVFGEWKEAWNTLKIYESMMNLNPFSTEDLLHTHRLMMKDLSKENGRFRRGEVRVYEGERVIHVGPPVRFVPKLLKSLIEWYQESDLHPLVKSAVFRYEFECIHPFSDGNGKMGRLWHIILMGQWKEMFYCLPMEEWNFIGRDRYLAALGKSYKNADGSAFVEMILRVVQNALDQLEAVDESAFTTSESEVPLAVNQVNISKVLEVIGDREMSALDIMHCLGLKHRPTFRSNYLNPALECGAIARTVPDKPNSRNQRYIRR